MFLRIALGLLAASALAQESLQVGVARRGMLDAYLTGIANLYLKEREARLAAVRTPEAVRAWQDHIRKTFIEGLGGLPEKTPLNARVTGTLTREGYRIENLIYQSLPGFPVTANVYVPTRAKPPYPALLGVAGHSNNGKAAVFYQRAWIEHARRGILVIAYDPPGQGERLEYYDPDLGTSRVGVGTREHTMAGLQCLLTGTNVARYFVWDGIRAVDYLLSRGDVDPQRIAVAGNSGGGTQSAYLAVAEPRLAAAAPSCYLTSWEKLFVSPGPQDSEQVIAGFLSNGLDFPDYLIAFAPKPITMMTAIRDFFPIDGARATYAQARRMFEILGAAERVGFFEYDDPHGWSKPRREATYRWMERWLNHREDPGVEPDFEIEPDSNLYATPTGLVATSMKAETVHSLNRALAEKLAAARPKGDLPARVARRIGFARPASAPAVSRHGEIGRDGYRIEKLALATEPGILLPALAFVPSSEGRKPAILYLNPAGKAADAAPGGDIEGLVRAGHLVLALDPRGWGETGPARGEGGYRGEYQTAMRALLVGKTMLGMQAADVVSAFDYLAARPDVDAGRIGLYGKGNGGVLCLYAAVLEPRFAKLAIERAVASYLAIARSRLHDGIVDIVVPRVLGDFDLPDLAAQVAPRPLWVINPATPTGSLMSLKQAQAEYPAGVQMIERPEGWPLAKVCAGWLR